VLAIYRRARKDASRGQWIIPSEGLFRYLLGLSENSVAEYLAAAKVRAEGRRNSI
jgi:hypothetical protein